MPAGEGNMDQGLTFDAELIRRYDKAGPRYTSYPTAVQFHQGFGQAAYRACTVRTNEEAVLRPLSLYFHLPFCDTVCYYCACNKVVTKDRSRSGPYVERLCRETALQGSLFDRSRSVDQLHWGGGTPTFISHEEMRSLVAVTRTHFSLRDDDTGEYSVEIDPREVRPDTLALLRELGFNRVSLGVQDFDPRVQKAVNRVQSEGQTLQVLEEVRRLGYRSVNVDLIYGLPFQSVRSFGSTLDKVIAASPDRLSIFNYAHLPEMFKPQRRIAPEDLPAPAEKLGILQMTIERMTDAGYVYIGMDHFARPDDELAVAQREGKLHRNFQGYSTHADCDLVGMGVTAIGKVADAYSQNVKDLETYYQRLDEHQLPVLRGVELNPDDRLRREVITQLICHWRVDIPEIERGHGIVFGEYFAEELSDLAQLQDDGLIALSGDQIRILPVGKLLIRNVCMVFDRYLRKQAEQRFSRVI
jgi:oxygen-independent coproporphyrinogen-3 oxidase